MATKIRLKRMGAKKRPFFRVVVVDSRAPQAGRVIEVLGTYQPLKEPAAFEIKADRMQAWLGKGAVPSEIVRKQLGKIGILNKVDFSAKPQRLSKEEEKKIKEEALKAKEAPVAAPKAEVLAAAPEAEESAKGGSASGGKKEAVK